MKNLLELTDFVLDIGNGIGKSLADGKIGLDDAFNFKDALFSMLPAIKGISQVDDDFFNLNEGEQEVYKAHVASKLQLDPSQHNIEEIAENVLDVIISFNGLIGKLVGYHAPKPEA